MAESGHHGVLRQLSYRLVVRWSHMALDYPAPGRYCGRGLARMR